MGRRSCRAGALPRRHRPGRHRHRDHALHGGAHRGRAARPAGAPRRMRRDDRLHVRRGGHAPHADGPVQHGRHPERRAHAAQEAARQSQGNRAWYHRQRRCRRTPDPHAAAPAEDPALHPRHGPGRACVFSHAPVLARGFRRERREPGAVSGGPLRRRTPARAARHAEGCAADRVSGDRRLSPAHEGPHRRTRRSPTGGRQGRHGRAAGDAFVRARRQRGPLRRRDRGPGNARTASDPGLRHGARRPPRGGTLLPVRGCADRGRRRVAHRFLAGGRPRVQRREGSRGDARASGRALPSRASGGIPDHRTMGCVEPRLDAGGEHHDGRDPRAGRRDRSDGVRRARRRRRRLVHRLCTPLHVRRRPAPPRHVELRRARRHACRPGEETRRPAAYGTRRTQTGTGHLQLSAQRGQHGNSGVPVGVRVAASHADRPESCRLHRRGSGRRGQPAPPDHRGECGSSRRHGQRACPHCGGRPRSTRALATRDRSAVGLRAGPPPERRPLAVRPRRRVRQRVRRHPARFRLRRRSDAPAVREGLRADPRVLGLLPLAARRLRRTRSPAFRDAWRPRVHAGPADRTQRRRLARSPDRRPAQLLSLRRQQSVGGRDREAPRCRHPGELSHAAGSPRGTVSRTRGPQDLARPVARHGSGRAGTPAGTCRAHPDTGRRSRSRRTGTRMEQQRCRGDRPARGRDRRARTHADPARHARGGQGALSSGTRGHAAVGGRGISRTAGTARGDRSPRGRRRAGHSPRLGRHAGGRCPSHGLRSPGTDEPAASRRSRAAGADRRTRRPLRAPGPRG
jgi:hypothetical protein